MDLIFNLISMGRLIPESSGFYRGAVPIILTTYPAAADIYNQHEIFNIVFFAVALSNLLQGTTIGKLADILKSSGRNIAKHGHIKTFFCLERLAGKVILTLSLLASLTAQKTRRGSKAA